MKKRHLIFLIALLLFPQVSLSESLREALAAPTQYIADTFFTATGVSHFIINAPVEVPDVTYAPISAYEVSLRAFTEEEVLNLGKALKFSQPNAYVKEEMPGQSVLQWHHTYFMLTENNNRLRVAISEDSQTHSITDAYASFEMIPGPGNAEYGVHDGELIEALSLEDKASTPFLSAQKKAEDVASQIAPELSLLAVGLTDSLPFLTVTDTDRLNLYGGALEDTPMAYLFIFGHCLDGIPVTVTNTWGLGLSLYNEPYTNFYCYEQLYIQIVEDTIVSLRYNSPYTIGDKYLESYGELLTFEEVVNIAQTILPLKYASAEINNLQSAEYIIDRIAFGYARIMMPNEPDRCILVPAWDFFGTYSQTYSDGAIEMPSAYQSLLTIDAVYGKVIDRSLGY